jgi:hypothetical protein
MDYAAHLLESKDFAWGVIVTGLLMLFLMFYAAYMRMQSLYLTAKNKGREKIGSRFYYIVEESEYNLLTLATLPVFGKKQMSQEEARDDDAVGPVFMSTYQSRSGISEYWNGAHSVDSIQSAKFYRTKAEARLEHDAFRLTYPLERSRDIKIVAISDLKTDPVAKETLLSIARIQLT